MADSKGKASSMNKFAEKNDEQRPTILMLMDKYGLGSGTVHAVVDETNSHLHWLLEDGKHFVNKNMEGIHWKWLRRGVVPVGEKPAGGKRKLGKLKGKLEDEPLMQLELQSRATRLGARMMMLEHRMPTEFQNMISRLEELEGTGTSHKRVSSVQQTAENHVQADLCREEVRKPNIEVRAGSVGASQATAAQPSQREQGTQAYEAQRPTVFSRLGTPQNDGGVGSLRPATARDSERIVWNPCFFAAAVACRGVKFLDEDGRPVRDCPRLVSAAAR